MKRATIRPAASSIISVWPSRKGIGKRSGCCSWPIGSAFRSSAWSIRPAPFQAFRQRNGGRPRRLPVRPNNASLGVPMVAAVVGEGGQAVRGIAAANRVLMFEHAVYSVISPEGCASILWRTADKAADAAEAMRVTANHLLSLGVVDRVVPEPLGGAHRDPAEAVGNLKKAILEELDGLANDRGQLLEQRRKKFLSIG